MSDPTAAGRPPLPPRPPGNSVRSRRPGAGGAPRRDRRGTRVPVIAAVGGLLVAGGLADRSAGHPAPAPVAANQPVPVAAPVAALSSSWFCAGATDKVGAPAGGQIVVANAGTGPLTARVRLVPSSGTGLTRTVAVAPRSTVTVQEDLPSHPAWIGAVVDLDGGAAAVDQVVGGSLGRAAAPCATSGSAQWYFPSGQTAVNATDTVTMLNPYPTDAVVDMSFTTEQGAEAPGDFQGLVVPAGGLLAVDLGSHLRRRQQIATSIHARNGRVVAWSTQAVTRPTPGEALIGAKANPSNPTSADPAVAAAGVVLTLGAPSTGTTWAWPDGDTGGGLDERYVIYNPSERTAAVSLSVALDQGQASPFQLSVGPQSVTTVVADAEARIPPGVGHTATLRSTNGVGVVAARTLTGVSPAARRGTGSLLGARVAASDWLIPVAVTGPADALAVLAPGTNPLDVRVEGWVHGQPVPLPGLANLTVPAGQRTVISLSARAGAYRGPVLVRASGPVYVESDLGASAGNLGLSMSTGVPLS